MKYRFCSTYSVVIFMALISACSDGFELGNPNNPKEIVRVDSSHLLAAVNDNEVAAKSGLERRTIEVSGVIRSIEDDSGSIVISLNSPNDSIPYRMKIDSREREKASALAEGEAVSIRCLKFILLAGYPYGIQCKFSPKN